ncbi:methionyl-tRNA formyltransferase [Desulfohalobium retbaense]|uniref:Methionyl-tRNA formyltransferase n=1 Tax=Desulfohalobium retbaense (strain ATCC 49708 / DSM 5692 / JCM 16813 / HR100) TaxID=485915 RepID=C8WZ43_DESRD|nr:methionyl-tRNA formyltransferase [Desulfohalobium retbaense]ACV67318.1 methionyl-tRNA formyltransferase [Desulfohalobium retbaense DSM 5692]
MAETGLTPLRIVFMGTPEFAAVPLSALAAWDQAEIVGVYTQPDRPCGRGRVCRPCAVKEKAQELGIPVFQPQDFKSEASREELHSLKPDVLVVAAYGLILPQTVLDIAPMGAVNIHASLLPKYRGAAPIQRALLHGEPVTGITIMQMEAGLDSGPILLQRALGVGVNDTAADLHDELADLGSRLVIEALAKLRQERIAPVEQDPSLATYAPKLVKTEGVVDWNRPAQEVHNQLRALYPWPGSYFIWHPPDGGEPIRLTVFPGAIGREKKDTETPGQFLGIEDGHLALACVDKIYLVPRIQPAGRKALDPKGFFCGYLSRCAE